MNQSGVLFDTSAGQVLSAIASASTPADVANAGSATGLEVQAIKQKRKRNRAILSCQPCHERKQQCDRAKPCGRCSSRGSSNECIYYEQSSQRTSRIKLSESDERSTSELTSAPENAIQNQLGDIEPAALIGLEALLHLVQASSGVGAGPHFSATGDRNPMTDQAVQVAAAALGQLSQQTAPGAPVTTGPMAEILHQIRVGHVQPPPDISGLSTLRTHFPNHALTGHLLYSFFEQSSVPWLWNIIDKPNFDRSYVTFSSGPHPPSFDFIALLAMVCAVSLQFLPKTPNDISLFSEYEPGREVLEKRLCEFAKSVLISNDTLLPSLENIQALFLLAIYQLNEGNLTSYYNTSAASIRMAQSLSIDRDLPVPWKESEIRRIVWWRLFILDRQQCLILRRPYIIHEQHFNVATPNTSDQIQQCDTEQTFFILQIRLAKLVGKIWDKCFALHLPSYCEVFGLEEETRKYELDLTSAFHLSSQGATVPQILFQNRTLILQIYHARILLLRPFLFFQIPPTHSSGDSEKVANFQSHASYVCVMFCKRLLARQLIMQNQVERSQTRWADCVARIFDVTLTLAIAIISGSTPDQNEELGEWISLAQNILRDLGDWNTLAPRVSQYMDFLQNAARTVRLSEHGILSPGPTIAISEYMERATQTIAQPQPSMSDLFDMESMAELFWKTQAVSTYSRSIPSLELCCGGFELERLQRFMDDCAQDRS